MFDINKIIQTVNYVLSKYDYKLNYTKLIKLLYILDKEALNRWETVITNDKPYSMNKGPVLSGIFDLIKGNYHDNTVQTMWNSRFIKDGWNLVSLFEDKIKNDELSRREIDLIDEMDNKYHDWSYSKLIEYLHDKSPEWEDPKGSSKPISKEKILNSLGYSNEEAAKIIKEEKSFEDEEEYLKSNCY